MANDIYKRDQSENNEPDVLGQRLNAALANFADVEPRAGLEDRILAQLQTHPAHQPRNILRLWPAFAFAAMLIAIAVSASWRSKTPEHEIAAHNSSIIKPKINPSAEPKTAEASRQQLAPTVVSRARKHDSPQTLKIAAAPKLDQFPSPQPWSEQELALARYVKQFPAEATLVAQAQQESEIEFQKKIKEAHTEDVPSDSGQQER
jgi:hypothetical protein